MKFNYHGNSAEVAKSENFLPLEVVEGIIGRGSSSAMAVPKALVFRGVSRIHAEITCKDGIYYIKDAGSMNGTLVNNTPLTDSKRLNVGDIINLGGTLEFIVVE